LLDHNAKQRRNLITLTLNKKPLTIIDFNVKGKNDWTPLHYAVFSANLTAVELFIKADSSENIDFFARDADGKQAKELAPFNSPIYKMLFKKQQEQWKKALSTEGMDCLSFNSRVQHLTVSSRSQKHA